MKHFCYLFEVQEISDPLTILTCFISPFHHLLSVDLLTKLLNCSPVEVNAMSPSNFYTSDNRKETATGELKWDRILCSII